MECPKCGSGDLKRLSVIVSEGTYTETSETTGVVAGGGASTGGLGAGGGTVSTTTTTTGKSQLAQRFAPPQKKSPFKTVFAGLFVSPLAGFALGGIVDGGLGASSAVAGGVALFSMVGVFVLFVRNALAQAAWNRDELPGLFAHWERSFHCGRCGEVFEADL